VGNDGIRVGCGLEVGIVSFREGDDARGDETDDVER
jgi:hypothetical protein